MNTSNLLRAAFLPFSGLFTLASCVITEPTPAGQAPLSRQQENVYYVPSSPNTRFLKRKNDISFDIQHTSGSRYSGKTFQASYLPSEHLGIIGGFSTAKNKGAPQDFMTYKHFELGAGYIKKMPSGWHFENYFGAGLGKIDNSHFSGLSSVKYTRFFVQPAIAHTNPTRKVSIGFASRVSAVNFSTPEIFFPSQMEPYSVEQLNMLTGHSVHVLWEPAIILNAGWKHFEFNVGYSHATDFTNGDLYFAQNNLTLGVSLQMNIAKEKPLAQ